MDEDIIEGEVIDSYDPREESQLVEAFDEFEEKVSNPLLNARARSFEQRLNLLQDFQEALLHVPPDDERRTVAASSKPALSLARQLAEVCGETLVHFGTWLIPTADSDIDTLSEKETRPTGLPFEKPYLFCYPEEGPKNESTK